MLIFLLQSEDPVYAAKIAKALLLKFVFLKVKCQALATYLVTSTDDEEETTSDQFGQLQDMSVVVPGNKIHQCQSHYRVVSCSPVTKV